MKRLLAAVSVALLLVPIGCRPAAEEPVYFPENTPIVLEQIAPDDAPALQRTQQPAPEEASAPSAPFVHAEWYVQRNVELHALLKRNGSFACEQDINLAIDRMQIDPDQPMVALTFDDGPVPGVTDQILDILEDYGVRATFFIVGTRLKRPEAAEIVGRAIALGCEIGNHTWSHRNLTKQSYADKMQSIEATNKIVYEQTGFHIHLLRPPGGASDAEVKRVAEKMDMAVVNWSQSGNVYERDPKRIAQNVQKQIINGKELHDGDIILLHDTKKYMVDAVKIIVPQLLDEGYQLVTVWELLHCSADGYTPGVLYRHQ